MTRHTRPEPLIASRAAKMCPINWIRRFPKGRGEQWTIEKGGRRGSGRSALAARHDDDDIYIYIYMHIYIYI